MKVAILVMEIEEVLLASTIWGRHRSSRVLKTPSLTPVFSVTASIAKSTSFKSSNFSVSCKRERVAFFSSAEMAPFLVILSRLLLMVLRPLSANSKVTSLITT